MARTGQQSRTIWRLAVCIMFNCRLLDGWLHACYYESLLPPIAGREDESGGGGGGGGGGGVRLESMETAASKGAGKMAGKIKGEDASALAKVPGGDGDIADGLGTAWARSCGGGCLQERAGGAVILVDKAALSRDHQDRLRLQLRRFRVLNGVVLWSHTLEHVFLALASYVSASESAALHNASFQACVACTVLHMGATMMLLRLLCHLSPSRYIL